MVKRRDELLHDNLKAEMVPMVFACDDASGSSGMKTKYPPMAYVKDLPSLIKDHLDYHERYEMKAY